MRISQTTMRSVLLGTLFLSIPIIATLIDLHMGYEFAVSGILTMPALIFLFAADTPTPDPHLSLYFQLGIGVTAIIWLAIGCTLSLVAQRLSKKWYCVIVLAAYVIIFVITTALPTYKAEMHRRRFSAIGYTIEQCEKIDPAINGGVDRDMCIRTATTRRVNDGDVDPVFCDSTYVTQEQQNSTCWGQIAIKTMDIALCEKVRTDYGEREECIAGVALKKQDPHLCESIGTASEVRDQCFADIAKQKQDASLCSNVRSDKLIACKLGALQNNQQALLEVCNTPNLSPDDLSLCKHEQNISPVASTDTCTGITNELLRTRCWNDFGASHGGEMGSKPTTAACDIAANPVDKDNCIEGVAETWAYPSVCDPIEDAAVKHRCIHRATIMSDYIRDFDAKKDTSQYVQYWDENGFKDSVQ